MTEFDDTSLPRVMLLELLERFIQERDLAELLGRDG